MTGSSPANPAVAAELTVIERLLKPVGFHRLVAASALIRVGDGETTYSVLETDDQAAAFEERQRGAVNRVVKASSVMVAVRLLTYELANAARPSSWPSIAPTDFAPGTTFGPVEEGQLLSWGEHWTLFSRHLSSEWDARRFSWTVRAAPDDVAASYLALDGAPLFGIDLEKEAPGFPRVVPPAEPHQWYSPEVRRGRPT